LHQSVTFCVKNALKLSPTCICNFKNFSGGEAPGPPTSKGREGGEGQWRERQGKEGKRWEGRGGRAEKGNGRRGKGGEGRGGEGRGGKEGRAGKGRSQPPHQQILDPPLVIYMSICTLLQGLTKRTNAKIKTCTEITGICTAQLKKVVKILPLLKAPALDYIVLRMTPTKVKCT
jgi:hypothetical protein